MKREKEAERSRIAKDKKEMNNAKRNAECIPLATHQDVPAAGGAAMDIAGAAELENGLVTGRGK